MFAVIPPALISGAVADRTKFWGWTAFVVLWVTIVYFPVAHWVFAFDGFTGPDNVGGWIANTLKAEDFAGGTAVHINAGAAALALAIVLGKRRGWPREPMRPHNLPFVLLGMALLWFGWFGFNAGSALSAGDLAATAFTNTMLATATALIGWLLVEQVRDGHPTTLGAASGAVAGLVAITPACGYVDTWGALAIGVLAGLLCQLAIRLKYRFGYDDSLDVVAIHGIGGVIGMLMLGLVATDAVNPAGADGLFYGGGPAQLGRQALSVLVAAVWAFGMTALIAWVVSRTIGFRAAPDDEHGGIDESEHAETAYEFSTMRTAGRGPAGRITEEGDR